MVFGGIKLDCKGGEIMGAFDLLQCFAHSVKIG